MSLDSLPTELIAHIGCFLKSSSDCNACYEAAKCFHGIKYDSVRAYFQSFPDQNVLQTLYKRRPCLKIVSFSFRRFMAPDLQEQSTVLRDIRNHYGHGIEYALSFHDQYDVKTLLQYIPVDKCSVLIYIPILYKVDCLYVPPSLRYLEIDIFSNSLTPMAYDILPLCDRLHINHVKTNLDPPINLSSITDKTRVYVTMDGFAKIIQPVRKNKIDMLRLDLFSYLPLEELHEFYADPESHVHAKEMSVLNMALKVEDFTSCKIYKPMRYYHVDAYVFAQPTMRIFHPMLLAYLRKADKMDILPLNKVYFMCMTKDDYVAARIMQIILVHPTIFVPYMKDQPYVSSSVSMDMWRIDEFNRITPEHIERVHSTTSVKELCDMLYQEELKVLWSVFDM